MARTKVLLKDDVPHVGVAGEVVEVAPGHARNFLLPRGLAVPATPDILAKAQEIAARRKKVAAARRSESEALAGRLAEVTVTIQAAAGPDGTLFGSVAPRDIVKALADEGIRVAAGAIQLEEPLKQVGVHSVALRLPGDVAAALKVWIVEK